MRVGRAEGRQPSPRGTAGERALAECTAGNSWIIPLASPWDHPGDAHVGMALRSGRHNATDTSRGPGTGSLARGCRRHRRAPPYLEDGVQVRQRGPPFPGVAHPPAVGIVLIGGHHVHRVVAEGPGAEGAAGEVGGVGAVAAGPLGGCVGTPATLLCAQEGADGEAAAAVGQGGGQLQDGQLGHCPCPGPRWRCLPGEGWGGEGLAVFIPSKTGARQPSTHPPPLLTGEKNWLEPPRAGQGEKK